VWPLGGLGLAGIGTFAYFGLSGKAEENTLRGKTGCAPSCTPEETDPVRTKFLIANVSLGVGIVALGAATIIAFLHQSAAPAAPAAPDPE
jgi:hypothetical protein